MRKNLICSHEELEVYQLAFELAMRIFRLSKKFPKEETYSLTDQIRKASRSVCTGISESWRRRRYVAAFVNKLNESETEAAEAQTWLRFALECQYIERNEYLDLHSGYDRVLGKLVTMINNPEPWILRGK